MLLVGAEVLAVGDSRSRNLQQVAPVLLAVILSQVLKQSA